MDYDTLTFTEDKIIEPINEIMVDEFITTSPDGVIETFDAELGARVDLSETDAVKGHRFLDFDGIPSEVTLNFHGAFTTGL